MIEDIKMITKRFTFIGLSYKESTSFSDMDETIIREAELDILTLGDDLSGIYNKFRLSSKKCKRDVDICGCDLSVFVAWKKNIIGFSSRVATVANKGLLDKPI